MLEDREDLLSRLRGGWGDYGMSGGGRASDIDGVWETLLVTELRPQEVRWANEVVPQVKLGEPTLTPSLYLELLENARGPIDRVERGSTCV